MDASEFEQTVGGHNSHVNFAVLVVVSLGRLLSEGSVGGQEHDTGIPQQGYIFISQRNLLETPFVETINSSYAMSSGSKYPNDGFHGPSQNHAWSLRDTLFTQVVVLLRQGYLSMLHCSSRLMEVQG